MSAYLRADERYQAELAAQHHNDVLVEHLADEWLDNPDDLNAALTDLDETAPATRRLASALHTLYHDSRLMTPEVMQVRAALYGVVKQHCQAVLS